MNNLLPLILVLSCGTVAAADLDLARLKIYSQERISSYDRTGANDDGGRANPRSSHARRARSATFSGSV